MNKAIPKDQNGSHPPKGDGIPDGVEKPIKPAGATDPKPDPKSKDGNVEEDGRGRLTREQP
jgi:hypothetical protein